MFLQADTFAHLPGIRHGFFTRQGGVSGGLYAGLNCGPGSQDDPAHVTENRARAAQALGASPSALCTLYQVHGADVITVQEPWPAAARPQADALVTDRPGLLLGILTADCVPVLLVDPKARIIGAAHAGWKGAFAGVTDTTIAAMETLGGWRDRMIAAIGPAIGWSNYEVDEAFLRRFLDADGMNEQFFRPSNPSPPQGGGGVEGAMEKPSPPWGRGLGEGVDGGESQAGETAQASRLMASPLIRFADAHHLLPLGEKVSRKYLFNVKGYVAYRLAQAGVHHVQILGNDTYAEEENFFSFRRTTHRAEADYGRQLSAIMLVE